MYQSRPRPAPVARPESFLTLRAADAGRAPPAKPRPARWPALLVLAAIVAPVGGAIWYRQPLTDLVEKASYGGETSLRVSAADPTADTILASSRPAAAARPTSPAGAGEIRRVKSTGLNMRAAPAPIRRWSRCSRRATP